MKKQLKPTLSILLVLILSAVVYLAACKKGTTTIVGTWTPSKTETVTKVNGTTTSDTSYTATPAQFGFSTLTFSSNGQYSEIVYPSGADSTGNYTYSGGILTFTSGKMAGSPEPASISGNTLTITAKLDTITVSPLVTQQSFYSAVN